MEYWRANQAGFGSKVNVGDSWFHSLDNMEHSGAVSHCRLDCAVNLCCYRESPFPRNRPGISCLLLLEMRERWCARSPIRRRAGRRFPEQRDCCFSQRRADKAFGRKGLANDCIPRNPCTAIFTREEPPVVSFCSGWNRKDRFGVWSSCLDAVTIQPSILDVLLRLSM